jgi:hypothetical protein
MSSAAAITSLVSRCVKRPRGTRMSESTADQVEAIRDALAADRIGFDEAKELLRRLFLSEPDPTVLPTIFQTLQKLESL